jgi:hypothetical protein
MGSSPCRTRAALPSVCPADGCWRIHLWTAAHGLSLGHMNQITERVDRERQLGLAPRFGDASRGLIPDAGFQQLVAFRIGYPSGTDWRRPSPRRPAAAVIR